MSTLLLKHADLLVTMDMIPPPNRGWRAVRQRPDRPGRSHR